MEIRCKSSKRFLMNIEIEKYKKLILKAGVKMDGALRIEIPCPKCRMIEVFDVYETHYQHISSYKFDNKNKI